MTEHHLKIVPVHTVKAYRGSTGIAPLSFNLGTRWTWVINFMPQPFYTWKTASIPTEYRTRGLWVSLENRKSLISTRTRIPDHPDCTESLCHPHCPGSL